MVSWPLAKAKAKLSELVEEAVHHEPQQITKNGKPIAVVLSIADWKRSRVKASPKQNLADFVRASPLVDSEIDLSRSADESRPLTL